MRRTDRTAALSARGLPGGSLAHVSLRCRSSGATATGCTSPAARSGSGVRTPGTELPERAERIRAALAARRRQLRRRRRAPRRGAARRPRPRAARVPRRGLGATGRPPACVEDPGQDRVVPYLFPHPGLFGGLEPAPAADPTSAARRALRLRHDDADRPGHLGGGARRRRRRAHRRRPGARPASAPPTRCCRPPGHHATRGCFGGSCYLNNAAAAAAALFATRSARRSP